MRFHLQSRASTETLNLSAIYTTPHLSVSTNSNGSRTLDNSLNSSKILQAWTTTLKIESRLLSLVMQDTPKILIWIFVGLRYMTDKNNFWHLLTNKCVYIRFPESKRNLLLVFSVIRMWRLHLIRNIDNELKDKLELVRTCRHTSLDCYHTNILHS